MRIRGERWAWLIAALVMGTACTVQPNAGDGSGDTGGDVIGRDGFVPDGSGVGDVGPAPHDGGDRNPDSGEAELDLGAVDRGAADIGETDADAGESGDDMGPVPPDLGGVDPDMGCQPTEEICNGEDDDCDGIVDTDTAGFGAPCEVGVGACAVGGEMTCGPEGLACNAVPGEPRPEVCNTLDDDCNGTVDDPPVCDPVAEDCAQPGDEDGNGRSDCDDPVCVGFPGCPTPIAAPGEAIVLDGSIDRGGPRWARPHAGCRPSIAADHLYGVHRIVNATGALQLVDIRATWLGDGYLHVFTEPFDPRSIDGCVAGNDDADGRRSSRIAGQPIEAGQVLVIVASTALGDHAFGDYHIRIGTWAPAEECAVAGDDDVDGRADCDDPACADFVGCPLTPIPQPGGAVVLDGSINALDPVWNRPDGCQPASRDWDYHYQAHGIVNPSDVRMTVDVLTTWNGSGYLYVFAAPFDLGTRSEKTNALGCAAASRNDFPRTPSHSIEGVQLDPGQVLVLVASTVRSGDLVGDYQIEIRTRPHGEDCAAPGDEDDNGLADCRDLACAGFADCTVTPIAAPGGAVLVEGRYNSRDPRWGCPDGTCPPPGADAPPHDVHRIVNTTGARQVIDLQIAEQRFSADLHVFTEPFDLIDYIGLIHQTAGFGNDPIEGIAIESGQMLVTVVSRRHPDDPGYDLEVRTRPAVEDCAVPGDEDGDGLADCDDPACEGVYRCPPIPIADPDGAISIDGFLDGHDDRWPRPWADCGGDWLERAAHHVYRIANTTGAPQFINITLDSSNGLAKLHVFRDPFDPAAVEGCIVGLAEGIANRVRLEDGQVIALVVSTADPSARYELQVRTRTRDGDCPVDANGLANCYDADCIDRPECGSAAVCAGVALPDDPQGFVASRDLEDDGWRDGGRDTFDGFGRLRMTNRLGGWPVEQGFVARPGRRQRPYRSLDGGRVLIDYTVESAFEGNAWIYSVLPVNPRRAGPVDVVMTGNLGSDDDTRRVDLRGRPDRVNALPVLRTDDGGPERPPVYTALVPADVYDRGAVTYAVDGDRVTATAEQIMLPFSLVVAASYADDAQAVADAIADACGPPPEDCVAPGDEDGNGLAECADFACADFVGCPSTEIAAPGGAVALRGSIDVDDPLWAHPWNECRPQWSSADYHFDMHRIVNATGAPQRVDVQAAWSGNGFLHVFAEPFDVINDNVCVAANDNMPGDLRASLIEDVQIDDGQVLVIVASTHSSRDPIGPYDIEVRTRAVE